MACASSIPKMLIPKWYERSIYARIKSAAKEGRKTIELFRPCASSKAHRDTFVLLRDLERLGIKIEPMPCSNPMVNLFVLSNFENLE